MAEQHPKPDGYLEQEHAKLHARAFVHEIGQTPARGIIEYFRDASGTVTHTKPFDAAPYSRMKYGNPPDIDLAAREVFGRITRDSSLLVHFFNGEVIITNEAREVPTASFTIMVQLVEQYLNPYLAKAGAKPVTWVRSERSGEISATDYGSLSSEERKKRIAGRGAFFSDENKAKLQGKKVILFDDLVITGTYENNQVRLLTEAGVPRQDIMKLYWVQIEPLTGLDPTFETRVNQTAVRTLPDLIPIVLTERFVPTERIIKYIFGVNDGDGEKPDAIRQLFRSLCTTDSTLGRAALDKFYQAMNTGDAYSSMPRFQKAYQILLDVRSQA
jgi:hypothetical protein